MDRILIYFDVPVTCLGPIVFNANLMNLEFVEIMIVPMFVFLVYQDGFPNFKVDVGASAG